MPPTKTLRALGLGRGMTFLDVGCGPGFFTLPACRVVGKRGEVLACDTSPAMLRAARKEANELTAGNLKLKRTNDPKIPFADECADMAMLGFVLHETESMRQILSETRRVLRPGGRVVVMEWHRRQTDYGPPMWARLSPQETKREVRAAGLSVVQSWDYDDDTYFVVARHRNTGSNSGPFSSRAQKIARRGV